MDHAEQVDALLLLAPALDPENEKIFWVSYPAKYPPIKWITPKSLRVANDEKFAHAEALRQMLPHYKNLDLPITFINGDKDWIVPPVNAEFIDSVLQGSPAYSQFKLIRKPEFNHFIPWSDYELVKEELLQLLEKVSN